jgi:hypothetical protein
VQQRERAFHDPAVDAKAGAVLDAAPGDVRGDLEPADLVWVGFMVVAAIRVQVLRAPQWLSALAADRRYGLDQRDELGNVLRCDTTLRFMMARLSTTATRDAPTRPGSRLSSLRNSAWMAAEGSWTSGGILTVRLAPPL